MAAKKTKNQARSTKNEQRFGSAFGEMAAGGPAALPLRCLTEPNLFYSAAFILLPVVLENSSARTTALNGAHATHTSSSAS